MVFGYSAERKYKDFLDLASSTESLQTLYDSLSVRTLGEINEEYEILNKGSKLIIVDRFSGETLKVKSLDSFVQAITTKMKERR